MTRLLIGGAIAALAIASVAAAAQPAPTPPPGVAPGTAMAPLPRLSPGTPHVRMIIGGDRVMTRSEVADHVGKLFARLDTNRDGFITKDEVDAIHQKMMGTMGMAHDMATRFHDGGMPMPERGAMFDRLDTNHDGSISRQEFMAGKPQVREERVMILHGGPDGAPGGPEGTRMHHMEGMHMHGMGMGFGGNLFEMADGNHDGRVSLAEAQAAALAHFDKADLNHDGKITPDERQQMHQTMRIERREG